MGKRAGGPWEIRTWVCDAQRSCAEASNASGKLPSAGNDGFEAIQDESDVGIVSRSNKEAMR